MWLSCALEYTTGYVYVQLTRFCYYIALCFALIARENINTTLCKYILVSIVMI